MDSFKLRRHCKQSFFHYIFKGFLVLLAGTFRETNTAGKPVLSLLSTAALTGVSNAKAMRDGQNLRGKHQDGQNDGAVLERR
jgi:hypothetical protein